MAEGLVQIEFEKYRLQKIERMLRGIPNAMPKVISRAINRTATPAKTQTAREISKDAALKIGDIKKSITLVKATYNRWQAEIGISRKRIQLKKFGAKQTKKGVSYKVRKKGKREKIEHAFIQTLSSGHEGVFKRKGEGRLPIVQLFGPSLGYVFEEAGSIAADVTKSAYEKLRANIDSQVKFLLARRNAG